MRTGSKRSIKYRVPCFSKKKKKVPSTLKKIKSNIT